MEYKTPVCKVAAIAPMEVVCGSKGQIKGLDYVEYDEDDIWE